MSKLADYPSEIRPLSADEGGGYLISYPDFSDCISDGETVEEAQKKEGCAGGDDRDLENHGPAGSRSQQRRSRLQVVRTRVPKPGPIPMTIGVSRTA